MRIWIKFTAFITLSAFLLCSCVRNNSGDITWSSPQACIASYTAGGAILGAATGALAALASSGQKKVATGAAIGGATGGALAFAYAWGHCFAAFTKVKSEATLPYQDVRKEIGYKSQQGTIAKIKEYSIDPVAIAPGDNPTLNASYYIMTPGEEDISVTETIALKIYDTGKNKFVEVGKSSETIVVQPGRRRAVSEIPIPSNAEDGKFFIVFKVSVKGKSDQKELPLTITNNGEILAKAKEDAEKIHLANAKYHPEPANKSPQLLASGGGSKNIAENTQQIEITTKTANFRENPDATSKLVAKASKGDKYALITTVTISGKKWCQVKLENGSTPWVSASLCKKLE
jgi:hypothetical protein